MGNGTFQYLHNWGVFFRTTQAQGTLAVDGVGS
jgi:hypothetical protein